MIDIKKELYEKTKEFFPGATYKEEFFQYLDNREDILFFGAYFLIDEKGNTYKDTEIFTKGDASFFLDEKGIIKYQEPNTGRWRSIRSIGSQDIKNFPNIYNYFPDFVSWVKETQEKTKPKAEIKEISEKRGKESYLYTSPKIDDIDDWQFIFSEMGLSTAESAEVDNYLEEDGYYIDSWEIEKACGRIPSTRQYDLYYSEKYKQKVQAEIARVNNIIFLNELTRKRREKKIQRGEKVDIRENEDLFIYGTAKLIYKQKDEEEILRIFNQN